ncbi:MAG: YraN family protein [Deltaproteobacteria bacterium]|nr:YraN family protein [Deltaproteobacteria bacterium]
MGSADASSARESAADESDRGETRPESRRARGSAAEELAASYLEDRGYRLIARNFRTASGEVDLIAFDGEVLCFIEVRSRHDELRGHPLETIDRKKIRRVVRAAEEYLKKVPHPWPEMRFDAVGIVMSAPPQITLVRDAFEALP